jgi:hypothetical protein
VQERIVICHEGSIREQAGGRQSLNAESRAKARGTA